MTRTGLIAAAMAVAVHVALGLALPPDGSALGIDLAAFDAIEPLRTAAGIDVVKVLTDIASFPAAIVVAAIGARLAVHRGRRDQAVGLVAGMLALFVAVNVTKDAWDRPRPEDLLTGVHGLSFPSGHAAYSTVYLAVALTVGRRGLVSAAVAVMLVVGASRLYLHVHYLTDVLAGFALGIAVLAPLLRR